MSLGELSGGECPGGKVSRGEMSVSHCTRSPIGFRLEQVERYFNTEIRVLWRRRHGARLGMRRRITTVVKLTLGRLLVVKFSNRVGFSWPMQWVSRFVKVKRTVSFLNLGLMMKEEGITDTTTRRKHGQVSNHI